MSVEAGPCIPIEEHRRLLAEARREALEEAIDVAANYLGRGDPGDYGAVKEMTASLIVEGIEALKDKQP